ncbi:hypothetical protein MNB_SV-12-976 [hydrothermal vent metagenome]|uniref:Uncharacterized protein n=1 Tax=hydrothermal vent metagenome TaxID=652676 RepID=A0A1W1BLK7_9ZZZZ
MKKLIILSLVTVTTLFSTDVNKIDVGGTVLSAAIVGFDNPITENLVDNTFTFKGISIDIGTIPLGGKIAPVTKNIYVKTNATDGVTMEITDPKGYLHGNLLDSDDNMVPMRYSLMGSSYAIKNGGARDLVTATNSGTSDIGTFVIEQKSLASPDQPAGEYSVLLNVKILAR